MDRKFNPILDEPPTVAIVGGREYKVNTDFRVVLSYFRIEGDDAEKAVKALFLFFGEEIYREDAPELLTYLGWYVSRGKEPEKGKKKPPVFDLDVDSGRIFAAFFQVYRLNLRAGKDRLHWWHFCELLEAMPEGTHMAEVVSIRQRKITKDMTPAEKNELKRLQDTYRIGEAADPMDIFAASLKGAS